MSDPASVAAAAVPVVACRDLRKTYRNGPLDVPVLLGIDLDVAVGERVAIVGASGSGKSTLLHLLGGLDLPTGGEVRVEGAALARLSEAARGTVRNRALGFIYQFHHLLPEFTALENVAMPLAIRRMDEGEAKRRAGDMLAQVGLENRVRHLPGELSGGERQRVALARALAARPRVLLLDEPLSNLDAQLRVSTRGEIRRVQEETGVTALYVTHDQSEALALGHRVAVLRDGRVEQLGTPDEIWERPANTWVARFVGTPPMNLVPDGDGHVGFRPEDATCTVAADGDAVFELAERAGADRLWHLRKDGHAVIVRGGVPPERGARVRVDVPPERLRRFDAEGRAR